MAADAGAAPRHERRPDRESEPIGQPEARAQGQRDTDAHELAGRVLHHPVDVDGKRLARRRALDAREERALERTELAAEPGTGAGTW